MILPETMIFQEQKVQKSFSSLALSESTNHMNYTNNFQQNHGLLPPKYTHDSEGSPLHPLNPNGKKKKKEGEDE